eukprot:jgi/Ulvmu1/1243/UM109_0041.1
MKKNAFALLKAGAKKQSEQPGTRQQEKRSRSGDNQHVQALLENPKLKRRVEHATERIAGDVKNGTGQPQGSTASLSTEGLHTQGLHAPRQLSGPNAFSILSASAEKAFQAHYFHSGVHDGEWYTEIWPVGQAQPHLSQTQPAWSAQARVTFKPRPQDKPPDDEPTQSAPPVTRQGEVRLRSNIAGGTNATPQTVEGRRLAAALRQPVPPGERYTGGAPLLKSALQKCVRRRLARDAVRLAYALLAMSPSDALRRVAVMCIEDAALHPQLPAVVWMMCAVAKGFVLTVDHSALVLRVVWDLASTHIRDALRHDDAAPGGCSDPADLLSMARALPRSAAHARTLVSSLLLRAAYGGMGGDVAMLHSAARVWLRRFQAHPGTDTPGPPQPPGTDTPGPPQPPGSQHHSSCSDNTWGPVWAALFPDESLPWAGIGHLRRTNFPLAGVDHHISRILTPLLSDDAVLEAIEALCETAEHRGEDPEAVLGALLWTYRSGVSCKVAMPIGSPSEAGRLRAARGPTCKDVQAGLPALGKQICSLADAYAIRFIARCFS